MTGAFVLTFQYFENSLWLVIVFLTSKKKKKKK